ncbi:MAG TPA: NADH-quinone oxidoreductase subunit M [Armatimonadota bacterium]|jgi:NADH-quinone oxidoreductase subunit M
MILAWLILIPLATGLLAGAAGMWRPLSARLVALAGCVAQLLLVVALWGQAVSVGAHETWRLELTDVPWIPELGISFRLSADGLSLVLLALTAVLGLAAVLASWREIQQRVGFFHFQVMLVLAGVTGVFLAADLFLFYFFWELMLVPMYFLIDLWGHERRHRAAVKFFLFTQLSGLLMLVGILGLVFANQGHERTFSYQDLLAVQLAPAGALALMLGFWAAFAVKLPVVPFHTWLPDAHTEAPTAGSVLLAGLLLKTGAYGMIRFCLPLFPQTLDWAAPVFMALGVVGIIYGAVLAFAQTDFKRLIAYTSISHMGFVLIGVYAGNEIALTGAIVQMICHGLSTGGLFILAGALQERLGTRDLGRMGGLWSSAPRAGALAMVLAMASLGLPGLGNFVGEILVIVGAYAVSPGVAVGAAVGLVFATVYALWMMHRVFFGRPREGLRLRDLGQREVAVLGALVALLVILGLHPQPVIDMTQSTVSAIQSRIGAAQVDAERELFYEQPPNGMDSGIKWRSRWGDRP